MDYYTDDDPYDGWMNQNCGGGGILYFPYGHGLNGRVKGEKFIVTYLIDDEFPTLKAKAYHTKEKDDTKFITLYGHTKRWAMRELTKKRSEWVVDTL